MSLEAFYAVLGVDFNAVLRRLGARERINKFVRRVRDDKTIDALHEAMTRQNEGEAFRAAHTLKGIALNLDLLPLSKTSTDLTELLRGGEPDWEQAQAAYERLLGAYGAVMDAIDQLDN